MEAVTCRDLHGNPGKRRQTDPAQPGGHKAPAWPVLAVPMLCSGTRGWPWGSLPLLLGTFAAPLSQDPTGH